MAFVSLGNGFITPGTLGSQGFSPGGFAGILLIDATGEKVGLVGRVWFPGRTGTKAIRKVRFRFGTVVKAGGSALTASLQDVSLSSGPPGVPDETQDQTVAIANADANFLSNTWYTTGAFNADRTVTFGDLVAFVLEYDGSGRLGSDSVIVNNFRAGETTSGGTLVPHAALATLKTGGSWAIQLAAEVPNLILEFSDGTFGILDGSSGIKAVGSQAYNSATAGADEYAMAFQVPISCKCDGAAVYLNTIATNAADFDVVLYSGTTALATVSVDANTVRATGNIQTLVSWPEITLSPGTQYYLSIRPSTTGNVTVLNMDVDDATMWDLMQGSFLSPANLSSRVDAGAWAAITTTRRLVGFGIRISSIDAGSAGGLLTHPGMSGGMRG